MRVSISKDILATGIPASAVLYTLSFASMIFCFSISMIAGKMGVSIFASGNRIYLLGPTPITAMCSALMAISEHSMVRAISIRICPGLLD